MRRVLFLLLGFAMCFASGHAANYDFEVDGVYYKITPSGSSFLTTVNGDKSLRGKLVLDSVIHQGKTYYVREIGDNAFEECRYITSIKLGDSVRSIGKSAFLECRGAKSLSFGNGVEQIGRYAFCYCWGLDSIVIPPSVKYIGYSAFAVCDTIKEFRICDSEDTITLGSIEPWDNLCFNCPLPDSLSCFSQFLHVYWGRQALFDFEPSPAETFWLA